MSDDYFWTESTIQDDTFQPLEDWCHGSNGAIQYSQPATSHDAETERERASSTSTSVGQARTARFSACKICSTRKKKCKRDDKDKGTGKCVYCKEHNETCERVERKTRSRVKPKGLSSWQKHQEWSARQFLELRRLLDEINEINKTTRERTLAHLLDLSPEPSVGNGAYLVNGLDGLSGGNVEADIDVQNLLSNVSSSGSVEGSDDWTASCLR
ncbi:hypothetical protein BDV97DRAFT_398699 [Delphinella strobiligena]|nr:hypothetical protein BDV97DRAFT_398699 [Delphinella strobiligena]